MIITFSAVCIQFDQALPKLRTLLLIYCIFRLKTIEKFFSLKNIWHTCTLLAMLLIAPAKWTCHFSVESAKRPISTLSKILNGWTLQMIFMWSLGMFVTILNGMTDTAWGIYRRYIQTFQFLSIHKFTYNHSVKLSEFSATQILCEII